jgi:hypothetical protein
MDVLFFLLCNFFLYFKSFGLFFFSFFKFFILKLLFLFLKLLFLFLVPFLLRLFLPGWFLLHYHIDPVFMLFLSKNIWYFFINRPIGRLFIYCLNQPQMLNSFRLFLKMLFFFFNNRLFLKLQIIVHIFLFLNKFRFTYDNFI